MSEITNPVKVNTAEEPNEEVEKKDEEKADEVDATKVITNYFNFNQV